MNVAFKVSNVNVAEKAFNEAIYKVGAIVEWIF